MVRPVTSWPAAVSSSAIARPLASVASVRVSLTVRMKQRTDTGARALCSASLMKGHCSADACYHPAMPRARCSSCLRAFLAAVGVVATFTLTAAPRDPFTLDRAAAQWVDQTLMKLTRDEKIGQLIVP